MTLGTVFLSQQQKYPVVARIKVYGVGYLYGYTFIWGINEIFLSTSQRENRSYFFGAFGGIGVLFPARKHCQQKTLPAENHCQQILNSAFEKNGLLAQNPWNMGEQKWPILPAIETHKKCKISKGATTKHGNHIYCFRIHKNRTLKNHQNAKIQSKKII